MALSLELGVPIEEDDEDTVGDHFGHAISVDEETVGGNFGENATSTRRTSGDVLVAITLVGHPCPRASFVRVAVEVQIPPPPMFVEGD